VTIEFDAAAIRLDQAGDHVENRGLAGAVRAEQTDRLATANIDADAAHDLTGAETLFHAMHSQVARTRRRPRRGCAVGLGWSLGRLRFGRLGFDGRWRRARFFDPGRIQIGQWRFAGHRRRIAHRARQHLAHAVAKRGNILARAREPGRNAFGRAPTKHAE
jgi:hypothetical protein